MRQQIILSDATLTNAAFAEVFPDSAPTAIEITTIRVDQIIVRDEMGIERVYGRKGGDPAWAVDILLENGQSIPAAISTDEGDIQRIADWVGQNFEGLPTIKAKAGRA